MGSKTIVSLSLLRISLEITENEFIHITINVPVNTVSGMCVKFSRHFDEINTGSIKYKYTLFNSFEPFYSQERN